MMSGIQMKNRGRLSSGAQSQIACSSFALQNADKPFVLSAPVKRQSENVKIMKIMKKTPTSDDMLVEYEFDYRKAKPNRFAAKDSPDHYLIELDPDVAEVFKTSEAVNQVLRAIVRTMPKAA